MPAGQSHEFKTIFYLVEILKVILGLALTLGEDAEKDLLKHSKILVFINKTFNAGIATQKVEICHTLDKLKPDVAIFQETKLNTKTKFIKVEGYRVHRRDRNISRKGGEYSPIGGGLITLIRDSVFFQIDEVDLRLNQMVFGEGEITEVLLSKLLWRGQHILITNFYIPPIRECEGENRQQTFKADNIFGTILNAFPECLHIIAGDSNAHHELWSSAKANELGNDIFNFIESTVMPSFSLASAPTYLSRSDCHISSSDITIYPEGVCIFDWISQETSKVITLPLRLESL